MDESNDHSIFGMSKIMKDPKTVVIPRKDNQLVQIADGALHLPAIGSILVAIRKGVDQCLPVGYFGFRVKGSMARWSSCELEAYSQAVSLQEYSVYIRESNLPIICLTDNIAVVEASKKIARGLFSASPRLQTLITAMQRYRAEFKHISGKLPTDLINVADFISRNPIECKMEECKICLMSKNPDTSYCTIRSVNLSSGSLVSSRKAWKEMQNSCPEIQSAISHITAGTVPSRKK